MTTTTNDLARAYLATLDALTATTAEVNRLRKELIEAEDRLLRPIEAQEHPELGCQSGDVFVVEGRAMVLKPDYWDEKPGERFVVARVLALDKAQP